MERMTTLLWGGAILALAVAILAPNVEHEQRAEPHTERAVSAQSSPDDAEVVPFGHISSGDQEFPVTIRRPEGPPVIELTRTDPQGRKGKVACSTCHSVRDPNFANRSPSDLDEFHQNMPLAHGDVACYACHNPDDTDTLKLADGTAVEYSDVMTMCSQCHGPQARDYERGAHGGMTGYWDLSRGPRTRNNCIDCHDPHLPKFPTMQPTFKPRDRFLSPPGKHKGPVHEQFSSQEVGS